MSKNLKIFFLTTNDKIFLPLFYEKIFSVEAESIAGVAVVDDPNFAKFLKKSLAFMGILTFCGEVLRQLIIRMKNLFYSVANPSKKMSIEAVCGRYNIPCLNIENVNGKGFGEYLNELGVTLIISVACPQILKKAILNLPADGCINVHYGLLPDYRGMYPSFWVLANGERETGVTIHYMAEKIDAGAILVQRRENILPRDSFSSLVKRLKTTIGPEALLQAIDKIRAGEKEEIENRYKEGSYYSFPTKEAMRSFKTQGRKWF